MLSSKGFFLAFDVFPCLYQWFSARVFAAQRTLDKVTGDTPDCHNPGEVGCTTGIYRLEAEEAVCLCSTCNSPRRKSGLAIKLHGPGSLKHLSLECPAHHLSESHDHLLNFRVTFHSEGSRENPTSSLTLKSDLTHHVCSPPTAPHCHMAMLEWEQGRESLPTSWEARGPTKVKDVCF